MRQRKSLGPMGCQKGCGLRSEWNEGVLKDFEQKTDMTCPKQCHLPVVEVAVADTRLSGRDSGGLN